MGGVDVAAVRVQVLGPVRGWHGERELRLGPPQQRAVLAVLALAAGQAVPRHELIEAIWDAPPATAEGTLYTYISRLRAVLEPGRDRRAGAEVLASAGPGYLLRVAPGQVDAGLFTAHAAAARRARAAGELRAAVGSWQAALALWQGSALAGLEAPWARLERARLEEARLAGVQEQVELRLELGGHSELVAELTGLVGMYPLREGLAGLLMLALYRCGRQAEALVVFRHTRRMLVAELGIEPGPELRQMHERVLAADPALGPPHQAVPPDGAAVPAAPPTLVPRQLPGDVAGFTGRAAELTALDDLLGDAARRAGQVTGPVVISAVSGTAGVGKTALAVRWAHRAAAAFPDGQLYVNLRGYDPDQPVPPGQALAAFLRALGVASQVIPLDQAERAALYRSLVCGRRLLVVLDNAASEEQVRPLLPGSPSVLVVVTSRDALTGLVARDGARRLSLDLLPAPDAVALLRTLIGDRVDAAPAAAEALATLCARLPLALRVAAELAAAQPEAPLAELSAELAGQQRRMLLLDAGGDPRSGVASVFSWSYDHLPDDAARLFRLLGLHPGADWDGHATAALAGADVAGAARLLAGLARAHLIQPSRHGRYGLHDLLRGYAASLAARHDPAAGRRAALTGLFDYYVATCSAAMDVLTPAGRRTRPGRLPASALARSFHDQAAARAWLDTELATLTAIAAHATRHGWPGHAIQLAATLQYYLLGDHVAEAVTIHGHALDAARRVHDHAAQADALANLGSFYSQDGRHDQAIVCATEALALARHIDDHDALQRTLMSLGLIYLRHGRYQQAASSMRQSLTLARQLGNHSYQAINLGNLGEIYLRLGRYEQAASHTRRALALFRSSGDSRFEAVALARLGQACTRLGRYQQATGHLQQALTIASEVGDRYAEACALTGLAEISSHHEHHEQAIAHCNQALALSQEINHPEGQLDALNGAGDALLAASQPSRAIDRYTAALTLAGTVSDHYQQARAHQGLANAYQTTGQSGQAHQHRQHAHRIYAGLGAPEAGSMLTSPPVPATAQPDP